MTEDSQLDGKRVLIFVNQPIWYDAEDDSYSSDYLNLIDFLLEASCLFGELYICLPVGEGTGESKVEIPENVRILPLPHYHGPTDLLRSAHRVIPRLIRVILSEEVRRMDIVGTVAPSTLGAFTAPISYYIHGQPLLLLMRGDKRKTVAARTEGSWMGKLLIESPIRVYDHLFGRLSRNDDVVLLTIGDLSEAIGEYGYDAEGADVIYPLIPREWMIDEPRINGEPNNLLYVGRLTEEKGVDFLLRGFQQIAVSDERVRLDIVGSGPMSHRLQELSQQLDITQSVTFHGFVQSGPELWEHYDDADMLVLTSSTEGLPRVIAEAMARGLPVIATSVGGIPKIITNGENGMLVEPNDIDDFVATVETVRTDAQLREKLSKEGRQTAKGLTFDSARERLREVLTEKLLQ